MKLQQRDIETIGVIGSGQIGPDIALYFTKVLSPFGVQTVVVEERGEQPIAHRGVEPGRGLLAPAPFERAARARRGEVPFDHLPELVETPAGQRRRDQHGRRFGRAGGPCTWAPRRFPV